MKIAKAIFLIVALSILIAPMVVLPSYALHDAMVHWTDASAPYVTVTKDNTNDTLVLKTWEWTDGNPVDVTFSVNNTGGADIDRVQLHIYEENGAFFHFLQGNAPGWGTTILEKDSKGWARLIEFETSSAVITEGDEQDFTITFGNTDGAVDKSEYMFTVTTVDADGGSVEHSIYIRFDTESPIVDVEPMDGAMVDGTMVPCGDHYFLINVSAYDVGTGILNASISIDGSVHYQNASIMTGPGETWTLPEADSEVWNLANGTHTLEVSVWDLVGNKETITNTFTYNPPPVPTIFVSPEMGYASADTMFSGGMLQSEMMVYGSKVLGTNVTVSGERFTAGTGIDVNVTLPYGDYRVAETTVATDGTFETSFIFPTAPLGNYTITVYGTPCNKTATFNVMPQIVYDPNVVVGPAVVEVIATGMMSPDIVPETSLLILVDDSDAIQGVNLHAMGDWYIDANGTLQNVLTLATGREIDTGLYWPALEPGTYDITLFQATTGAYWNMDHWIPTDRIEHTNTITVIETLSDIVEIKDDTAYIRTEVDNIEMKLHDLNATLLSIEDDVATLDSNLGSIEVSVDSLDASISDIEDGLADVESSVGQIATDLDDLNATLVSVEGSMATVETTVGSIDVVLGDLAATVVDIEDGVATIETDVGTLTGTVESIEGDVATISTDIGTLMMDVSDVQDGVDQVSGMTTYLWIVIALSLIAAIAAVIAVISIYSKLA